MTLEAALLRPSLFKPVVDALLARLQQRKRREQRRGAEAAMREVIRELLLPQPDERRVEARLALARASGFAAHELRLAEAMLARHRETRDATRGKSHRSRRRKPPAQA
jgi:hypothetical protein